MFFVEHNPPKPHLKPHSLFCMRHLKCWSPGIFFRWCREIELDYCARSLLKRKIQIFYLWGRCRLNLVSRPRRSSSRKSLLTGLSYDCRRRTRTTNVECIVTNGTEKKEAELDGVLGSGRGSFLPSSSPNLSSLKLFQLGQFLPNQASANNDRRDSQMCDTPE